MTGWHSGFLFLQEEEVVVVEEVAVEEEAVEEQEQEEEEKGRTSVTRGRGTESRFNYTRSQQLARGPCMSILKSRMYYSPHPQ